MIYISHVSAGPVVVKGFTLLNAGAAKDGTIGAIVVGHNSAYSPITIQDNHFIGYDGGDLFDMGLWLYSGDGALNIQNNELEKMWQALLLERPRGGASVIGNDFHNLIASLDSGTLYEGEALLAMTYTVRGVPDNISNLMKVSSNSFSGYSGDSVIFTGGYPDNGAGQFTNVLIKNNTINAIGAGPERRHDGILLRNAEGTALTGGVPNAVVTGNMITGTNKTNDSIGIWLVGPNDNATIECNNISGVKTGIETTDYLGNGLFASGLTAHNNSISGNAVGVSNGSSASANVIVATSNWWRDASGPFPAGLGDAVSGNVDYTPWLTRFPTCAPARLTDLSPANMWIGLKNSDDVGTKFDLLAQVLINNVVVGSGELDAVNGGSSGFNNAVNRSITLALLGSPPAIGLGDTLSFRLSVRISTTVSGHRSGTARLWFNDAQAKSCFDAAIGGVNNSYYLLVGSSLGYSAGPGPKKTIDVFVDKAVGGNPFKPFGTWIITF